MARTWNPDDFVAYVTPGVLGFALQGSYLRLAVMGIARFAVVVPTLSRGKMADLGTRLVAQPPKALLPQRYGTIPPTMDKEVQPEPDRFRSPLAGGEESIVTRSSGSRSDSLARAEGLPSLCPDPDAFSQAEVEDWLANLEPVPADKVEYYRRKVHEDIERAEHRHAQQRSTSPEEL